jgi:hypothetical protein
MESSDLCSCCKKATASEGGRYKGGKATAAPVAQSQAEGGEGGHYNC